MRPSRFISLLIVAAVAAVIASCGGGEEIRKAETSRSSDLEAQLGMRAGEKGSTGPPRSLHSGRRQVHQAHSPAESSPSADASAGAHPVLRIREGSRVPIRTSPGGKVIATVGDRTEFGSPTAFSVIRTAGRWVGVSTPVLPNDRLGWIRLNPRFVDRGWTERSIHVNLSERRATLRYKGEDLRTFTVTVGAPGTTTPTGQFGVTDTFRGGLNPVYGCCAVALSAIQPDLPSDWPGGNRIAIHGNGTGGPLGDALSNGCLRANDPDVNSLVNQVDLGTPVFIYQ